MKKITVNGEECTDSDIVVRNVQIEISFNGENVQIYGEGNTILVLSNSCNLHIYGDHNSVRIKGNQSNLHIYGDHLRVLVENNDSNLHVYGTHNEVVVEKGKAVTYGYYGNTTIHPDAAAEVFGQYKKENSLTTG